MASVSRACEWHAVEFVLAGGERDWQGKLYGQVSVGDRTGLPFAVGDNAEGAAYRKRESVFGLSCSRYAMRCVGLGPHV